MKLLICLLETLPGRYSIRQLYLRVCTWREVGALLQLGIKGKITVQ